MIQNLARSANSKLMAQVKNITSDSLTSRAVICKTAQQITLNMYESEPDLPSIVEIYSLFFNKGWVRFLDDAIQKLNLTMALTLERHMEEMHPKDVLKTLWHQTNLMHRFSFSTYREIETILARVDIKADDARRLMKTYAIIDRDLPDNLTSQIVKALPNSSSPYDLIESVEAACVLKMQDTLWHLLQPALQGPLDIKLHQKLRVIRFASAIEKPELEMPLFDAPSEQPDYSLGHSRRYQTLHAEVDYILKTILSPLEPYYNVEDAYIMDFGKDKLLLDIDSKPHFFNPSRGFNYDNGALLNGYTKMKYRLLKKKGFKVATVKFFDWNKFDEEEKALYLKRTLRLAFRQ